MYKIGRVGNTYATREAIKKEAEEAKGRRKRRTEKEKRNETTRNLGEGMRMGGASGGGEWHTTDRAGTRYRSQGSPCWTITPFYYFLAKTKGALLPGPVS